MGNGCKLYLNNGGELFVWGRERAQGDDLDAVFRVNVIGSLE
jgi:hypothetical protein